MNEIQTKLTAMRSIMKKENLAAVHLRGVDWFSWATGGGTSVVIMTAEIGVAEVLITESEAWILTNRIEAMRLQNEEVSGDYRVTSFAWQDSAAIENFIKEKVGSLRARGTQTEAIVSDRPMAFETDLPRSLANLKLRLQGAEMERYRRLGRLAAEAMTEALSQVDSSWTENQVAGAGAKALWSRGLEPTLVLVAGHERGLKYRHPIAKDVKIGDSVMMVFCARAFGLYANLTRFVYFRPLKAIEKKTFDDLNLIEWHALENTRAGKSLSAVYASLALAYTSLGHAEQINLHHQGGTTGYLSRETVASPSLTGHANVQIETGMAFAWNPSLPGAKIEDTVWLGEDGIQILTVDPHWPTVNVNGVERPDIWVKK